MPYISGTGSEKVNWFGAILLLIFLATIQFLLELSTIFSSRDIDLLQKISMTSGDLDLWLLNLKI